MKIAIGVVGFLAVLLVGMWAFGAFSKNPQVAEIEQLATRLQTEGEKLPRDKQREVWQEMRKKMEQLPEADREQLREDFQEKMEARMDARLDQFFALSPEKRKAELDKQIDEMEKWRKAREARGSRQNGNGGSARQGQNRGGGGNRWGNMSEAKRLERRKARLDRSTPKARAQRSEYHRLVQQRRRERGLPVGGGPGRR